MSTRKVICAKCKVPIEGVSNPEGNIVMSCPVCGTSDTRENAIREATEHLREQTMETIHRPFKQLAARSKSFNFIPAPRKKRHYRFILES
jgi:uncharacterized Zn finger protein (UPF0148 family)